MKTITLNGNEYFVLFGGLAMQALGVEMAKSELALEEQSLKVCYYSVKYGQQVNKADPPSYDTFLNDVNKDLDGYISLLNEVERQQGELNPAKPQTKSNGKAGKKLAKV